MHLYKLVSALQAIDKAAAKRFSDYMNSPYFHHPSYVVELSGYLLKLHPNYTERNVGVAAIGSKCAKLQTKEAQSRAGSELLNCFEHFIALERWQRNAHELALYKLEALKELLLVEQAEKMFAHEMALLNKHPEQDVPAFKYRHLFMEVSMNGFDAKLKRVKQNDISPVLATLDAYYALKKLRYQCEALSRKYFFNTPLPAFNEVEILGLLEPYNKPEFAYVYVFVTVYKMLLQEDYTAYSNYYKWLKDFVVAASEKKLLETIVEASDFAVNLSVRWSNKGYVEASTEYLWWMQWKMQNNLLLENGKLLPVTYRNIAANAVITHKPVAWLSEFIEHYTHHLPEQFREQHAAFAKGLLHYLMKDYKRAVQYLQMADAKNELVFNAVIRRWQFMCLFEYDSDDKKGLLNFLEAYKKFVVRHKVEFAQYVVMFNLFIKYAHKLVACADEDERSGIMRAMEGEVFFPGKNWLADVLEAGNKKARPSFERAGGE